uniref:Uncharacterized protein n=1 Tax=Wuchereria bancrofti TaxID=6293 RepID=A0A1I8EIM2_WUCBA
MKQFLGYAEIAHKEQIFEWINRTANRLLELSRRIAVSSDSTTPSLKYCRKCEPKLLLHSYKYSDGQENVIDQKIFPNIEMVRKFSEENCDLKPEAEVTEIMAKHFTLEKSELFQNI